MADAAPKAASGGIVLFVGKTLNLPLEIFDQNAVKMEGVLPASIAWVSSDPKVATVDAIGNVLGVSEGAVKISATVTDGGAIATDPFAINVVKQIPTTAKIVLPAPAAAK